MCNLQIGSLLGGSDKVVTIYIILTGESVPVLTHVNYNSAHFVVHITRVEFPILMMTQMLDIAHSMHNCSHITDSHCQLGNLDNTRQMTY